MTEGQLCDCGAELGLAIQVSTHGPYLCLKIAGFPV